MRRAKTLAWLTLSSALVAARPIAAEEAPLSGKQLYQQYCASCHGLDGRAGTRLAKLFERQPPDLTRIAVRRGGWFPEVLVKEIVDGRFAAHGDRQMPVWGEILSSDQVMLITEHLYRIQDDLKSAAP